MRSDLGELARQGLVARVRGGVRALQQGQSEVGFDLRLRLEVEREARDRPRRRGDGRRRRGGRARREHDGATTSRSSCAPSASSSSSRTGCSSRPRSPTRRASRCSSPAACSASRRCRSSATSAPTCSARRASTRASSARAGSRLERGLMDLNPDEVRIKQEMAEACEQVYRDPRRHQVAPQRAALVRRRPRSSPGSSPTRARPPTRSRRGARPASTWSPPSPGRTSCRRRGRATSAARPRRGAARLMTSSPPSTSAPRAGASPSAASTASG